MAGSSRWGRPLCRWAQQTGGTLVLILVLALSSCDHASAPPPQPGPAVHLLALVYRGPASCNGCAEAAAALLRSSAHRFDVKYVGPNERLKISAETLRAAALYVQPGGGSSVGRAYRQMRESAPAIRSYVESGGRYLGICMGGYLAGRSPGFDLLPGDSARFIESPGASVTTDVDTIIRVDWRNHARNLYFQDGPYFQVNPGASRLMVLARYAGNGEIAAMVAPFGHGKVAASGPHPEATDSWYKEYGLVNSDGNGADLGHDLIDSVMR